ncbi:amidase [uncultured Vibrio sp.]|uniref:amidase n=1 Tax=uncultured Vibrio sp. TaxID=114054 RepID=UPI0025F14111|nr:amidase family protein [uncultured Vibrio sp.]
MKRRDFFKVVGATAASAAVVSTTGCTSVKAGSPGLVGDAATDAPLDATGMAELVRNKKATPKELVQEAQYKINKTNKDINAVVQTCFDEALDRADNINPNSPFAGVPMLYKDCIDVAGMRCTTGSKINYNNIPEKSSYFVRACENAGLNTIGLTNIPELMSLMCTNNELYGVTRNPWNLDYSVASSTGGGAAAVAAGYTPLVHSTDGGGSSRIPASACGIFGWKPSRDQLITGKADGDTNEAYTHQSFMSRSVRDVALALSVTEAHTKDDFDTAWPRTAMGLVHQPLNRPLRVGVSLRDVKGNLPDQETTKAIMSTVSLLEELGHTVVEVNHPITDGDRFWYDYMGEFGLAFGALAGMFDSMGMDMHKTDLIGPNVAGTVEWINNRQKTNPNMVAEARAFQTTLAQQHNRGFFGKVDVWLTPVTGHITPKVGFFDMNESNATIVEKTEAYMGYTPLENIAGNPAMSVPLYWTKEGLPVGSHFSAARGNDRLLLELAYQLEAARPWAQKKAPNYV